MRSLLKIALCGIFVLFLSSLIAQEGEMKIESTGGVSFFDGSWEEAVAKAKKENKYLMIDAYTDWCYWCKVMDKNTFAEKSVGEFFDNHIVAFKMDMEKGRGILMAMKYRVNSFPTFLFFSSEGPLVYRVNGYLEPAPFIKKLETEVMNPEKQFKHPGDPAILEVDFPEFYKLSFNRGKDRQMPSEDDVLMFLDQQEDLYSEVSWGVMTRFSFPGKYRQHFLDNLPAYEEYFGDEATGQIERMVYSMVMKAAKEKNPEMLNEALEMAAEYAGDENPEMMRLAYQMAYDQRAEDWTAYGSHAEEMMAMDVDKSNGQINSYAWNIYLHVEDKKLAKKAASWMEKVIEEEPSYAYLDTYAALLYKSGELKKAAKFAQKAIDVGKKDGEKVEETEALLKKIKGN